MEEAYVILFGSSYSRKHEKFDISTLHISIGSSMNKKHEN
jgi:hypothetical protein